MHKIADTVSILLSYRFMGNTVRDVLMTLVGILVGVFLVRLFQTYIVRRLRKIFAATTTTWDDLVITLVESNLIPALYVLIVYFGIRNINLRSSIHTGIRTLVIIVVTLLAVRVMMAVVNHSIRSYWLKRGDARTEAQEKNLNGIITFIKIIIWILGFVLLLDNLGVKVSAFVAGLGITGIAVALAAQAILGDLFSYFVIFFDQPFEVGHVIKVDNFVGEVEYIGLKTTRLRSGDGEQIIFSNKNLTDSRVQNFTRMNLRRVVFNLDVDFETPPETLRNLASLIKEQFIKFEDVTFERSHFKNYIDAGIRFESAYVIKTPDFTRFMDIQHAVNLGIREELEKAGIRLAVPSRKVRLVAEGLDPGFIGPALAERESKS